MLNDPLALGIVPDEGRGRLPFALIYGEPLIAVATMAVEAAEVTVVDPRTEWTTVVDCDLPLVIHDPLCPLTPAAFIAHAVDAALESDQVVAGVRAVTDTIKLDLGDRLGSTIDRTMLREVTSPIVLPHRVLETLDALPTGDITSILAAVEAFGVQELAAPPLAKRVRTTDDIAMLEALGRPSRPTEELLGHR